MIKRRKTIDFEPPFLLFFCTVILLFFASIISANLIFKSQKNPLVSANNSTQNRIYFNSVPEPDQILASNPVNIVINFKTRIIAGSEILLLKDGKKVNFNPTILDIENTSIRQLVDSTLPDGAYTIIYKSCTAPNICDNGNFNFYINKKISDSYPSFLSNNETAVTINNSIPYPKNLKISAGSNIVWVNHDENPIIIHSDPVPQNNYFPILSSPIIGHGKTYKAIFNKPGFYPYHLDLGFGSYVFGNIVVQ